MEALYLRTVLDGKTLTGRRTILVIDSSLDSASTVDRGAVLVIDTVCLRETVRDMEIGSECGNNIEVTIGGS